ncbi:cell wall integrity and stress response component 4-like isoform X3 [Vespa velutina]|uniref:cell wall integrity and stress response component 4-like isoform X3 n=1 Tax=Vespa velutina TaxID=202808 RepID=UPI001FB23E41|nr:cell wall integrity and stress response component 4-like isoform X3 [Vespa velutina]
MVHEGTGLWHAAGFNVSRWLMVIIHGYRVTSLILSILLNVLVPTEYHTSTVTAEIVVGAGNGNALGTTMTTTTTTTTRTVTTTTSTSSTTTTTTTTLRPLDVELPPTLPMTFGTENSTTISAQSGSMALLPCVVHNLGDGVVSWIKRKTVQELLTVGLITYANDERFQAIHFHHSEDWTLQIKYVQGRDAGLYQCQVSTHPPTSIFLFLEVVAIRVSTAAAAATAAATAATAAAAAAAVGVTADGIGTAGAVIAIPSIPVTGAVLLVLMLLTHLRFRTSYATLVNTVYQTVKYSTRLSSLI